VRERTENSNEPVFVAELASVCGLTDTQVQSTWRYLRDYGLIDTFSIPYTARIYAKGIEALDNANEERSRVTWSAGVLPARLGGTTMRGYGRLDSQEALDRAREVSNELRCLHEILPGLSDSELSAYSTKSLPIGTFLHSKGQAFSVLTEEMLANAFKEELERRKADTTTDRWLKKLKNNRVAAVVIVLAAAVTGGTAVLENIVRLEGILHPASTSNADVGAVPNMDVTIANDLNIQIDLCAFDRGRELVVECVTHGACRGPGAQGLGFPIDKTSKESAVYSCKQSCVSEAKVRNARCSRHRRFNRCFNRS